MDPITMAAGAMVIGGLVQAYNAEKTRGDNKARLNEIERMYNQIKPPDYNLPITAAPSLHHDRLSLPEFSGPQSEPKFNLAALTPQQIKVVGTFSPQTANLIKQVAPTTIQNSADMQTGRAAQLAALKKYSDIGQGEFDPEYQQMVNEAGQQAGSNAQSRQDAIIQGAQRRGISGSGLELASQIAASSNAMNSGAQANQMAATQAYKNRIAALGMGASLGSQIRGEDVNLQNTNAGIINDYNQRMSANNQNWEYNRANSLNDAQRYNLGVAQGIEGQNVVANNNMALNQQGRNDDLTKFLYGTKLDERSRQDALSKYQYGNQLSERDYQNQVAQSDYNNKQGIIDRQNNVKQATYDNLLNKAGGKAGVGYKQIDMNTRNAQDRNNAIQGITNAAVIYGQGQNDDINQQRSQIGAANRTQYMKTGTWMSPEEQQTYQKNMMGRQLYVDPQSSSVPYYQGNDAATKKTSSTYDYNKRDPWDSIAV